MTGYLDIAVVRIQSWLMRAPHLRGRRGASAMINTATEPDAVEKLLRGWETYATRCAEAGVIDGVIPLELRTEDQAKISALETHVIRYLRDSLPAASFESVLRHGRSWLDAQLTEDTFRQAWPASVAEWPVAQRCDWCSLWPARQVITGRDGGRSLDSVCVDCSKRDQRAGRATDAKMVPGTERELLARWGKGTDTQPRVADEFKDLAELGKSNDHTHLATIHADGNRIGELRRAVLDAQKAASTDERCRNFNLPEAISETTWYSLIDTLKEITAQGAEVLPIVAHLVGGDDVLVTLPAHQAWTFARSLQSNFEDCLKLYLDDAGLTSLQTPTLSAGIVFHHFKSPLSSAVDLAGELLTTAKKQQRGELAAIGWHDITHDGSQRLTTRRSVTVQQLTEMWPHLDALAACSGSAKQNLAALARDDDPSRLDAHARRLGLSDLVDRFTSAQSIPLADALGMVRWWRDA